MRYHLYIRQWIHIITNLTADSFANMLYVIKPPNNSVIVNTKKQGTTKSICKSTYTL